MNSPGNKHKRSKNVLNVTAVALTLAFLGTNLLEIPNSCNIESHMQYTLHTYSHCKWAVRESALTKKHNTGQIDALFHERFVTPLIKISPLVLAIRVATQQEITLVDTRYSVPLAQYRWARRMRARCWTSRE